MAAKDCAEKKKERFHVIDSPFTTAVREDVAVRGVYSLIVGFLSFHLLSMSYKYYHIDGLLQSDIDFLKKAFSQFHWVIVSELALMATFFAMILPVVRFRMQDKIHPTLFHLHLVVSALLMVIIPMYIRYAMDLHVVAAVAVIFEQIRYAMKAISFVVENEKIREEDGLQLPTRDSSVYFLFAPTLIYQPSYPVREGRDWKNIACWTLEIIALIWSTLTVINHGFMDAFDVVGTRPLTTDEWCTVFVQSAVLALHVMVGIGYGFLHCWNNIWGELIYFGDRTFYKNFFSSDNLYTMFNKWNFLIHSWIAEYLFKPAIKWTGSVTAAGIYAFLVSMMFHDYAVAVPLRLWSIQFTATMITASLMLPIFLAVRDFLIKHPFPSTLNAHVFFLICMGSTNVVMTVSLMFFAQHNCPHDEVTFSDLIRSTPHAPTCI